MPSLTKAEIHQIMTSGFATIAGSVMSAYMSMGISPVVIISSCVMSITASIALSKLRYPETEEPLTRGRAPFRAVAVIVVDNDDDDDDDDDDEVLRQV